MSLLELRREIQAAATPARAAVSRRFFKTGPGQYGEGAKFIGVTMPDARALVGRFWSAVTLLEAEELLHSNIHEERMLAVLLLIRHFQKGDDRLRAKMYRLYLKNTKYINNWDLVDCSAEYIVGAFLADKDRSILRRLAASKSLWERRIAMLATFHFIKKGEFDDALAIAEMLVSDRHDLMHKAVGWMLREIGKRGGQAQEEKFLQKYAASMPRTMLRYAIERFPEPLRKRYLLVRA